MKTTAYNVSSAEAGTTLDRFLADVLSLSRKKAKHLLDERRVFVNGRRVWIANHKLKDGSIVEVSAPAAFAPKDLSLAVIYEDKNYVIVDKPAGILSTPKDGPNEHSEHTIQSLAQQQFGSPDIMAAHRLDRDTSGCLLLAVSEDARTKAIDLFRKKQVRKTYQVITTGRVHFESQTLTMPVDGKRTVTHAKVLDSNREASHLLVRIETGRTHQIRKHLASLGHPVLGDRHYDTRSAKGRKNMEVGRQMLHASSLEFISPLTSKTIKARSSLPRDFRRCLKRFDLT